MSTCDNHPGVEAEHATCRFCLEEDDEREAKLVARAEDAEAKVAALEARLAEVKTVECKECCFRYGAEHVYPGHTAEQDCAVCDLAEAAPVVEAAERLDATAEQIGDYSFFLDEAAKRPEVEAYWQAVNAVEDEVEALRSARAKCGEGKS